MLRKKACAKELASMLGRRPRNERPGLRPARSFVAIFRTDGARPPPAGATRHWARSSAVVQDAGRPGTGWSNSLGAISRKATRSWPSSYWSDYRTSRTKTFRRRSSQVPKLLWAAERLLSIHPRPRCGELPNAWGFRQVWQPPRGCQTTILLLLTLATMVVGQGCTRAYYRRQADAEATYLVRQKANHPQWPLEQFNVYVNSESACSIRSVPTGPRCLRTIPPRMR